MSVGGWSGCRNTGARSVFRLFTSLCSSPTYFPPSLPPLFHSVITLKLSPPHYPPSFPPKFSPLFIPLSLSSPLSPSLPIFLVSVHTFISPSFLFVLHSLSSCPCPTCAHNPALLFFVVLPFLFSHFSSLFRCVLG